jgi:branched-chain amino acid aminotransferase
VSNRAALSQRSDMVVFLNGEFIPADQARVGVMTHALSYGTGCFEGIRGYWNENAQETYIFRAREHYERLLRSCRIMNIDLRYKVEDLVEISVELVRRNKLHENCYLRPFAYKSDEIIGVRLHDLHDHFSLFAVPMGDYVSTTGLRCGVSSWRRVDDNMIPARAKISGSYVNSALAKTEALKNGFDEAIMLTAEGHVSEGSAENIFLLISNELVTPPVTENILPGITRDTVIKLAQRYMDRATKERVIDRTELYCADEILLTGTGAQLAPVIEVDHRQIGTGTVGAFATEMQQLYLKVVRSEPVIPGEEPDSNHWCTPCFGSAARGYALVGAPAETKAVGSHNGHNGHNNGHNKLAASRGKVARTAKH